MKPIANALVLAFVLLSPGIAQTEPTVYPKMAPIAKYLLPREAVWI